MRLKQALKKYNFLKRLDISEQNITKLACMLSNLEKGSEEIYISPLGRKNDILSLIKDLDQIFCDNAHLINPTLLDLERSNRSKIGPRSQSVGWSMRKEGLRASFSSQVKDFTAELNLPKGNNQLRPINILEAASRMKGTSSSGLPFLTKKSKSLNVLIKDISMFLERDDVCVLFTRTAEQKKTRNVWGYPFALTLFETMFYQPFLAIEREWYFRGAIISPEETSKRITEIIDLAISTGRIIYSVDFAAFDASIRWQFIAAAFEYIKTYFMEEYFPHLNYISKKMYSIGILTPDGIWKFFHGIPSGATFTNCIDSMIQFGRAALCHFIKATECQVQGDDGVYIMLRDQIDEFVKRFTSVGMKLETSKSHISSNYAVFCQNLYHVDYRLDNGLIPAVYPLYRALNRLIFQESFVNFSKMGVTARTYYGIRTLTILENCKYHPLFEEFVKFILINERNSLDISQDSLTKYCNYLNISKPSATFMNHQYGSDVLGIRNFAAFKVASRLMEELQIVVEDCDSEDDEEVIDSDID